MKINLTFEDLGELFGARTLEKDDATITVDRQVLWEVAVDNSQDPKKLIVVFRDEAGE